MAKSTKSKWLLGVTGTALTAFVITQIGTNPGNEGSVVNDLSLTKSMSKEEREYAKLDWSNFVINGESVSGGVRQSDRQTRRS